MEVPRNIRSRGTLLLIRYWNICRSNTKLLSMYTYVFCIMYDVSCCANKARKQVELLSCMCTGAAGTQPCCEYRIVNNYADFGQRRSIVATYRKLKVCFFVCPYVALLRCNYSLINAFDQTLNSRTSKTLQDTAVENNTCMDHMLQTWTIQLRCKSPRHTAARSVHRLCCPRAGLLVRLQIW